MTFRYLSLGILLLVLPACNQKANPPVSSAPAAPSQAIPAESLPSRLEKALAEKRTSTRLEKISKLGQELSEPEILPGLELGKGLTIFREHGIWEGSILRRWCELNPSAAFDYLLKMPEGRARADIISLAAARLAAQNPEHAAKKVTSITGRASRSGAIEAVAEAWAKKDAPAALKWAKSLNGFERETALTRVRFIWVHTDPIGSYEDVKTLPGGNIKNSLITNIATEWGRIDPVAAQKWAYQLPEGPERQLGLSNVAESWADSDPQAAAAFASQLPAGEIRMRASVAVVGRWGTQDPVAAGQWAGTIQDSETRRMALSELMNFWGGLAPDKAGAWVRQLPPGDMAQAAAAGYVDAVQFWSPDLAAEQAMTLQPGLREEKLAHCFERWLQIDPDAAKRWLKKANLPAETKTRCLISEGRTALN